MLTHLEASWDMRSVGEAISAAYLTPPARGGSGAHSRGDSKCMWCRGIIRVCHKNDNSGDLPMSGHKWEWQVDTWPCTEDCRKHHHICMCIYYVENWVVSEKFKWPWKWKVLHISPESIYKREEIKPLAWFSHSAIPESIHLDYSLKTNKQTKNSSSTHRCSEESFTQMPGELLQFTESIYFLNGALHGLTDYSTHTAPSRRSLMPTFTVIAVLANNRSHCHHSAQP